MGSKKLVTKIRDALSRGSRSPSHEPVPSTGNSFVTSNLDKRDHKMVAKAFFAPHIQTDCDARNPHRPGNPMSDIPLRPRQSIVHSPIVRIWNELRSSCAGGPLSYFLTFLTFSYICVATSTWILKDNAVHMGACRILEIFRERKTNDLQEVTKSSFQLLEFLSSAIKGELQPCHRLFFSPCGGCWILAEFAVTSFSL